MLRGMIDRTLDADTHLRLLQPADADELFALIDRNRAHLRPWFEMADETRQPSDTLDWLNRMHARRAEEGPRGWSGIFHRGRLAGAVGVTRLDREKRVAEIGYWLSADVCRQGLATRACTALVDALVTEPYRTHHVGLRVAGTNDRSIRLAERLGFQLEGRQREADVFEGERRDQLFYGLLARDWQKARLQPPPPAETSTDGITLRRLVARSEQEAAARIMASTDPWVALGRTFQHTFATVSDPHGEAYGAVTAEGEVVGVVAIAVDVPLIKAYVRALAVKEGRRGGGLGTRLLRFAERRIARDSPNVFMCVTSFNAGARRLYERLGYREVGVITDFVIPGDDEILLRKTSGPWSSFVPA